MKPPNRLRLRLAARGSVTARLRQEWLDFRRRRKKARHRRGKPIPAVKTAVHLVGCQRSGTDMCVWVLDHCLDVDMFNEDHSAAFRRCRIRHQDAITHLIQSCHAPCIVFKPICDSHRVTELLEWHTPSRALWIFRDYRDVARSIVVKWGDTNLRHLKHLMSGNGDWGWSQWNREGYTPELLEDVREIVNDQLTPEGAAALYWYLRNQSYFTQNLFRREDVAVFRYRDLVTRPAEQFAAMCGFLGLGFSKEMAASVHARSVSKGRDIPLDDRVRTLCEGMLARLDAEVLQRGEGR